MKTKKLLSILLALMMMLSVVPMYAFAATTLSASNVTQWPTLSYKNEDGKMYYGQTIGEALIINDDEIVLDTDGNQVAGHFEFIDPTLMQLPGTNIKSHIKFVPDDTDAYTGFQKKRSSLLYNVETVTLVYVDEVNDPLVASEVEAGALLSTSTLSGGKMTNPYNPEEPNLIARSWEWTNPNTVVNESGYYEARFLPIGYTATTAQVYVKIAGEIPETTISEMPIIEPFAYDASITWKDVTVKGGVAVLKVEGTTVDGTFAVAERSMNNTPSVGSYNVPVTFTPADPEAALPYTFDVPVTVTKAPIKFVDENGNEIIPEITVPYGTKFYDVVRLLQPYVKGAEYTALSLGDLEYKECEDGTFTVTASAPSDGKHYETTELSFKVIVEPKTLNAKIGGGVDGYYVVDSSAVYAVKGTFDVYVNDELIASDVAYNSGKVNWEATENGTYTMKWVYNPVENDNFIINDVTTTMNVILPNTITYSGLSAYILVANGKRQLSETTERKQGDSITIGTDMAQENFGAWIITDANGNTVDLGIADLTATEITFTMPAYDINITYKTALDLAAENCDHICHSDNPLFQMLWKVLSFIFRLFDVQQYCDCGNLHYDAPLFG